MGRLYPVLAVLMLAGAPAAAAEPPCAPCVRLSVTPVQAQLARSPLNGATIVVRAGAGDTADVLRGALAVLHGAGAVAGLELTLESPDDPRIDLPYELLAANASGPLTPPRIFVLKQALARARGLHPGATILAVISPGAAAVARQALTPYVDAILPPDAPFPGILPAIAAADGPMWAAPADDLETAGVLRDLGRLQRVFPRGLARVTDRPLVCGGRPLPTFVNAATLGLVAYGTCATNERITSGIDDGAIERFDVGGTTVVVAPSGSGERFSEGVRIAGRRALTVEEIIARHEAFAARQAAAIRTRISEARFTLTFNAPGFAAPVAITSDTILYVGDGRTDLQQRNLRVNGVAFPATGGVPRLPLIEPERVASAPLTITLTQLYRYRLLGRDAVGGRPCYVVAFAPAADGVGEVRPLFKGRAFIDAETFALARIEAAQTGLRGPITVSEQIDEFAPQADGWWLPARSDIQQGYEGAGVRTPIHRVLIFDHHQINPPDFTSRLAAAYASRDVMLRDTADGFRYLVRSPGVGAGAAGAQAVHVVPASRTSRIRALAFGVLIDPNITTPLPFAGLSYVDFDLFGTGTQVNAFFGGTYGQLAMAVPSLGGTRWQLGGRAFAIASSYNDRAFEHGREVYEQDIRQRPAAAAVWLRHPVSARAGVRAEYDLDVVHYGPAETTAPAFVVPASQRAHAVRFAFDVQRAGWQASAWWSAARRTGWRAWGIAGVTPYDPAQRDYQRYGATVLREFSPAPAISAHVEAAWMGGRDLDRFSRFAFGTFDNRLHGYPSALVRYDRGGVLRTAVAWSVGKGIRVDGFADMAQVHDPGRGGGLRNDTGFGAAIEAPAPFGTLLALEWGYGVQGIDAEGRRGTQVFRVTAYKAF